MARKNLNRKPVRRMAKGWGKSKISLLVFGILVVAIILLYVFIASSRTTYTGDVRTFSDGLGVPGSESKLAYTDKSVSFSLQTSILPPDNVVTVWWMIFNNPEYCSKGQYGFRCGVGDLAIFGGDSRVESSLVYAGTDIPNSDRSQRFNGRLSVGDTSSAVFGPGLTQVQRADIQILVRVHGPVVPGVVDRKLSSFGGGCNNAPAGTGVSGNFPCENFQFAAYQLW